jgi:hypothetical protein
MLYLSTLKTAVLAGILSHRHGEPIAWCNADYYRLGAEVGGCLHQHAYTPSSDDKPVIDANSFFLHAFLLSESWLPPRAQHVPQLFVHHPSLQ